MVVLQWEAPSIFSILLISAIEYLIYFIVLLLFLLLQNCIGRVTFETPNVRNLSLLIILLKLKCFLFAMWQLFFVFYCGHSIGHSIADWCLFILHRNVEGYGRVRHLELVQFGFTFFIGFVYEVSWEVTVGFSLYKCWFFLNLKSLHLHPIFSILAPGLDGLVIIRKIIEIHIRFGGLANGIFKLVIKHL